MATFLFPKSPSHVLFRFLPQCCTGSRRHRAWGFVCLMFYGGFSTSTISTTVAALGQESSCCQSSFLCLAPGFRPCFSLNVLIGVVRSRCASCMQQHVRLELLGDSDPRSNLPVCTLYLADPVDLEPQKPRTLDCLTVIWFKFSRLARSTRIPVTVGRHRGDLSSERLITATPKTRS